MVVSYKDSARFFSENVSLFAYEVSHRLETTKKHITYKSFGDDLIMLIKCELKIVY